MTRQIRHMTALPPREQRHPFLRVPLVRELILEFFSALRFREILLNLDAPDTIQFQLGGAKRHLSWRQFILALGLHTGEEMKSPDFARDISTDGDFLGPHPSNTLIRDPMLRLCHRMMAHSITSRSQAPEKVTVIDLFYLRGLDVGSVNIPYLLAQYIRRFATGRKSGVHISGGQFVARLAEHFGLLTAEILRGLHIYEQLYDTWAWDAPIVDEGGQADLAPVQAPPPPPVAARTMPQRMARLEEDMHKIRRMLAEQREVINAMAHDFSRFYTWSTTSLARMMDWPGVTYTSYSEAPREYMRRVRCKTDSASTSAAQQDQQQPDP
ncbi:hypothetical protein Tco_0217645 [Tanacetum coccineum]